MTAPLLRLEGIRKVFGRGAAEVVALDGIDLRIEPGECLAVVGESGSGKSTLGNIVLGLLAPDAGTLEFDGRPLPARRGRAERQAIQLVQQNPLSALNPRRTVGSSLRLGLDVFDIGERKGRATRLGELLAEVGLAPELARRVPAALSGGQRQRVAIARALACQPRLVVLDEPTSALDVLVQTRVLRLLDELKRSHGLTYLFITHDLAVVRNFADRVAVLQAGRMVETAPVEAIFDAPRNPYTRSLVAAVPVVTADELALRQRLTESLA